jgi:hypothetical protein
MLFAGAFVMLFFQKFRAFLRGWTADPEPGSTDIGSP